MTLSCLEIAAVLWAANLDEALGGAADRADVLVKRRTCAFGGSFLTQTASHTDSRLYMCSAESTILVAKTIWPAGA